METVIIILLTLMSYGFGFLSGVIKKSETNKIQKDVKLINEDRIEAFVFAFKNFINKNDKQKIRSENN